MTVGQQSWKGEDSVRTTIKTFNVKALIMHPTYVHLAKDDVDLVQFYGGNLKSSKTTPAIF